MEMDGKQKLQTTTQFPLSICQITTQKSNTSHKTIDGRPPNKYASIPILKTKPLIKRKNPPL